MKLKKCVQMMLLAGSLLALNACSTVGTDDAAGVSDANGANGAMASGAGEGAGFGGQGDNMSPQQLLSKRTYYFDFNQSDVREEDKPAVLANADYLIAHPGAKIQMEGHTDPRGSREYNVALGERRGNAVVDLMKSRGVNPSQIRVVSYGAQRLAVPGHTEEDYSLDRRAVIVLAQN